MVWFKSFRPCANEFLLRYAQVLFHNQSHLLTLKQSLEHTSICLLWLARHVLHGFIKSFSIVRILTKVLKMPIILVIILIISIKIWILLIIFTFTNFIINKSIWTSLIRDNNSFIHKYKFLSITYEHRSVGITHRHRYVGITYKNSSWVIPIDQYLWIIPMDLCPWVISTNLCPWIIPTDLNPWIIPIDTDSWVIIRE